MENCLIDNLNGNVAFVADTTARLGDFYKIKALTALTFTTFSKLPCKDSDLGEVSIDMSAVTMAAGDEIVVRFTNIELATGSALIYATPK